MYIRACWCLGMGWGRWVCMVEVGWGCGWYGIGWDGRVIVVCGVEMCVDGVG